MPVSVQRLLDCACEVRNSRKFPRCCQSRWSPSRRLGIANRIALGAVRVHDTTSGTQYGCPGEVVNSTSRAKPPLKDRQLAQNFAWVEPWYSHRLYVEWRGLDAEQEQRLEDKRGEENIDHRERRERKEKMKDGEEAGNDMGCICIDVDPQRRTGEDLDTQREPTRELEFMGPNPGKLPPGAVSPNEGPSMHHLPSLFCEFLRMGSALSSSKSIQGPDALEQYFQVLNLTRHAQHSREGGRGGGNI